MAKMNKKLITLLHTLPSMGMAFIVLGVLLMVASFAFSIQGNSVLFAGLFFILAGVAGFVYSLKKDKPIIDLSFYIFFISLGIFSQLQNHLIFVRNYQFVSLTMDIDDFNLRIVLQMLTEFGDINIH